MSKEINLAWMYPDILNLHGERGNAKCFKLVAEKLGIDLNIDRIDNVDEKVDFTKYDILLFNAGELKVIPTLLKSLNAQFNELKKYIDDNRYILVTGTTGALFANNITRKDGESFKGLGFFDSDIKERTMVIGDDLYYELEDGMEIMGCQIQMIDVTLKDKPLGHIKYGYGNCGDVSEGARKNNLIFTNCLGPVFVKNPWFAEKIIKDICSKKDIEIPADIKVDYDIETKSLESTKEFIEKKQNKTK